jgi:hypothetical protein
MEARRPRGLPKDLDQEITRELPDLPNGLLTRAGSDRTMWKPTVGVGSPRQKYARGGMIDAGGSVEWRSSTQCHVATPPCAFE